MSGDPLTEAECTEARRFCGYPVQGGEAGWLVPAARGLLEYRLAGLTESERAVTRSFLATLAGLEAAVPAVGGGLDTERAAAWTRNPDELAERGRLLAMWSRRLCGFLGVPGGPGLASSHCVPMVV